MVKNDDEQFGARVTATSGSKDTGTSNSRVIELTAGDRVWLKCYKSGTLTHHSRARQSTFTGVMIHKYA